MGEDLCNGWRGRNEEKVVFLLLTQLAAAPAVSSEMDGKTYAVASQTPVWREFFPLQRNNGDLSLRAVDGLI